MRVYISGALTNTPEPKTIKLFYENIGKICEKLGMEPYIPHLCTDPIKNPDITPEAVFTKDKGQVIGSDLVIAYIGVPSLGVGMEIAYSEIHEIPVILLYEKGRNVSRFPRGVPNQKACIEFDDYDDALNSLENVLSNILMSKTIKP